MLDVAAVERLLTAPWRLEWHEELSSTNDAGRIAAQQGATEGLVVGAETQTEGRGRQGRRWVDIPGRCLLFSVLLRPPSLQIGQVLGLAAAASVIEAVRVHSGQSVGLRWPNDVVCFGRKLCGILVEETRGAYIVGVGINVLGPGSELPCNTAATTVEEVALCDGTGPLPSREALLAAILNRLHEHYRNLVLGDKESVAVIIGAADELKGRKVTVKVPGGEVLGVGSGVDAHGRLCLDTPSGRVCIVAGEVVAID